MLMIICGEDSVSSRDYLIQLQESYKSKNFEIVKVRPEELEQTVLSLSNSPSLFGQERILVTENLNKRISRKTNVKLFELLEKIGKDPTIEVIDWEDSLSQREINPHTKAFGVRVKEFKPEKNIFQLLDSCYPSNMKTFIFLLNQLSNPKKEMFIFIMLVRHIRNLILLKSGSNLSQLQPWQRNKLVAQTKQWSENNLTSFYDKLVAIDIATKSGKNSFGIKNSLELLSCYYIL